jgi:hypothetical protein
MMARPFCHNGWLATCVDNTATGAKKDLILAAFWVWQCRLMHSAHEEMTFLAPLGRHLQVADFKEEKNCVLQPIACIPTIPMSLSSLPPMFVHKVIPRICG